MIRPKAPGNLTAMRRRHSVLAIALGALITAAVLTVAESRLLLVLLEEEGLLPRCPQPVSKGE